VKTLAIIPARGGSKRVPGKNLRPLAGKSLVARSIETVLASKNIDRLVVSSDSEEVLAIARAYRDDIALKRPSEISGDLAPAIDYVRHALEVLEANSQTHFEAVVIVQPSSPFTFAEDIDATVSLLENSGADTAVSVMEVDHALHPAKFKVMEQDRLLPYFEEEGGRMAAHELPKVYVRNCSVYATRRATIDAGEIIGSDCRGYLMPRERSIDINDELDWKFCEFMLTQR
jgi:CMP-N,N'-diacetyllegionaminic acid synthase